MALLPDHAAHCTGSSSISLTVLPSSKPTHPPVKKSKAGPRRAIVLFLVNALIVAHVLYWLKYGMTLTPVEPSEAIQTLEEGRINAGFVFFIVALLSTFLFGRFFCGWACHVISLQDACTWLLGKIGIRPKPLRTRLLLLGPLLFGLYMFVWPTFRREVIFPLLTFAEIEPPAWLGVTAPFPGFSTHFMTDNFWATFPVWYIAIPFLFLCGFACVYFLGSKGFCTYGCPYGGFFAPLDKISIGRIVVSDACEGCGHCTAACNSNVRVHEEVRDFGMIVDPGCMKCLDCVSVCPNDALSFSFSKPAIFAAPRTKKAKKTAKIRPPYDLTLPQDAMFLAAGIVLFVCFRSMLNSIPMLMAAGMAAIGVVGLLTLWKLVTLPNVRLQNLQLKLKGRVRPLGLFVALGCIAYLTAAAWSGVVRYHRYRGEMLDLKVITPFDTVFNKRYEPTPRDKAAALEAISHLALSGPRRQSGIGWEFLPKTQVRLAWLHAVAGNLPAAEAYLTEAVNTTAYIPRSDWIFGLARIYMLQDKPPESGKALYERMVAAHPELHDVRLSLAMQELQSGNGDKAIELCDALLRVKPPTAPALPVQRVRATEILIDAGVPSRALEVMQAAVNEQPDIAIYRAGLATAMLFTGKGEQAIPHMQRAVELEPLNIVFLQRLAMILRESGQMQEAEKVETKVRQLIENLERK